MSAWNQPLVLRLASALGVLIGVLAHSAYGLSLTSNSEPVYPSASLLAYICRYGNINPFPIDYAFPPRLRDRLTLGRLTLPRKPWAYGDRVSHSVYRYSSLHSLLSQLHQSLPSSFAAETMLAYRCKTARSFGTLLKPRYIFGADSLDQ